MSTGERADNPAHAVLEPAATRVRDPRSGRSIWLAGLVTNAHFVNESTLRFTLSTTSQHTGTDREKMAANLRRQLARLGWMAPRDASSSEGVSGMGIHDSVHRCKLILTRFVLSAMALF